jgi:hypothetical protein
MDNAGSSTSTTSGGVSQTVHQARKEKSTLK